AKLLKGKANKEAFMKAIGNLTPLKSGDYWLSGKRRHPHSDIILQSILPHGDQASTWEGRDRLLRLSNNSIHTLNNQLKALAAEEEIYYLDLWPLFTDAAGNLRPHLTTDGLHLNANGYMVWSAALQLFTEWKDQDSDFNPNLAHTGQPVPFVFQNHLQSSESF
ncbi:MAG: GDSL-type esterase/lipase family protein, partial [Prochlorotrichaceae cyanobacterium]